MLDYPIVWVVMLLIGLRVVTQTWLKNLNFCHVKAHEGKIPEPLHGVMDEATYAKSVDYTIARGRLAGFEDGYSALVLLAVLFSGVLPWAFQLFQHHAGTSAWAMAAFLFAAGVALSLPGLPVDWFEQFQLEQKFGFNTSTQKIWWLDRLKMFLLAAVLGYPLLVLLLKFVEWTGEWWWLWAWGALMAFQFLMMVLAPVLIMPLFYKFTPLPEGSLRERLLKLAARTQFRAQNIQVMDGSKRSRHSNAFFTGFGRFRKIVLFDTLIAQLSEPELEAVLAHEIGHYKRKHLPKLLGWAALVSLASFYVLALLARQEWFYRAFGFAPGNVSPALLLFALLGGPVTFWLTPLQNWWARRFEYEADAFAAEAVSEAPPLVGALRKLHEKNLSNLTPHPAYSGFYYSHPTLLERERALHGRHAG
ncbi:MAG: M48 family peptidase [Pedosphaera sp.]|nr:M48 family peptidase [Pedosphaera sp.]